MYHKDGNTIEGTNFDCHGGDREQVIIKCAVDCYYQCIRSEDCVDVQRDYSIKLLSTGHKLSVTDYASKKLEKACDLGGKDFLLRTRSLDELISEIHKEMTGKVK